MELAAPKDRRRTLAIPPAPKIALTARRLEGLKDLHTPSAHLVQTQSYRVSLTIPRRTIPLISGVNQMARTSALSLVTLAFVASTAFAQDGILTKAGQALDNAGRSIRNAVETEVARGQIDAQDREVLSRVMRRVEWDKHLVGSTIQFEVQPGRVVILADRCPALSTNDGRQTWYRVRLASPASSMNWPL